MLQKHSAEWRFTHLTDFDRFDSSKPYFKISDVCKTCVLNEIIILQTEPNTEVMYSLTFPNKSLLINVPLLSLEQQKPVRQQQTRNEGKM